MSTYRSANMSAYISTFQTTNWTAHQNSLEPTKFKAFAATYGPTFQATNWATHHFSNGGSLHVNSHYFVTITRRSGPNVPSNEVSHQRSNRSP